MISDPLLQWLLTVAFTATGAYSSVRIAQDRTLVSRIGHAFHALMSAVMVLMCWPWWSALPEMPQIVLFGAGTVWYAAAMMNVWLGRRVRQPHVLHRLWHQFSHAIMMAAMVWMVVAMPTDHGSGDHAHHHGSLEPWAAISGVLITSVLLVSAATFGVEYAARRNARGGHSPRLEALSNMVMSGGMAAMCWPMIAG